MGKTVVKIKDRNVKDLMQCLTQGKCSVHFSFPFRIIIFILTYSHLTPLPPSPPVLLLEESA